MKMGSKTTVARQRMLAVSIAVSALVTLPALGYGQEAAIVGTVSDSTGAILPGVTITAIHEATGNTFTTVTDGRGTYRLPLRIGSYRITGELAGFAAVTRAGIELLVGQQAAVNLQMAPSTLQESVTVTAEAPLLDVAASSLAGNIDARQMQELPLNGRNWQDLALLAPGSRANEGGDSPMPTGRDDEGLYQLNIDGQQVTQLVAGTVLGNARFSRDAIAEFEFVTNRFDASQGRSAGVQVNAVTKSGTNTFGGTLSGFFRDDSLNAVDFIQRRVLPYSNQQVSGTFGGPIRRDRIHFFGSYEQEREPNTVTYTSPWPRFNVPLPGVRQQRLGNGRLDLEASPNTRMSVRASAFHTLIPHRDAGGANFHPSTTTRNTRDGQYVTASLMRVISSSTVNEIKAGYGYYKWVTRGNLQPESPRIVLRGYLIGSPVRQSRPLTQATTSIRNDFTTSYSKAGRHDLKLGGEYLYNLSFMELWQLRFGEVTANLGPVPANIEDLFPVWNDPTTWKLDGLAPITRRYRQAVGDFTMENGRHIWASWIQDDWRIRDC